MKIKIIGSGSIWSKCNSACYLIDDKILVDIPNGICKALLNQGINFRNIANVLITHFHGDHYFDVPFYLLSKLKSDDKKVNFYLSDEGINKIKDVINLAFPNTYNTIFSVVDIKFITDDKFEIDGYIVQKILVDHGRMKPAYGYVIEKDGVKIGFTGDSAYCKQIEYMARYCDVLVSDASLIRGNSKHMGIDNIIYLCKNYDTKIVTSHMDDDTRLELNKIKYSNLVVGEDNMEIVCEVKK
jgi:ribonuclease BN (tRNA processing enzyme)